MALRTHNFKRRHKSHALIGARRSETIIHPIDAFSHAFLFKIVVFGLADAG
jgi:hypothetical protein